MSEGCSYTTTLNAQILYTALQHAHTHTHEYVRHLSTSYV